MKKKKGVEVYFVIYIATIISFFAVEGEVRDYRNKQEDILYEVSADRIDDFIKVGRWESPSKDSTGDSIRVSLNIASEYKVTPEYAKVFISEDKNALKGETSYPLVPEVPEDGPAMDSTNTWYSVKIPIAPLNKEKYYYLNAELGIIPDFGEKIYSEWLRRFGEEEIVDEIIHNIKQRINKEGAVALNYSLREPFIPQDLPGPKETVFYVEAANTSETLVTGSPFNAKFFVGGVESPEDYLVNVVSGNNLFNELQKNSRNITISGVGTVGGEIELRASRVSDDSPSRATMYLSIKPPIPKEPCPGEIYIGDTYRWDGGIKEIASQNISLGLEGNYFDGNNTTVNTPYYDFGPYEQPGNITVTRYINGYPLEDLTCNIQIVEPPPPRVRYIGKDRSVLNYKIVLFGASNSLKRFQPMSGIADFTENTEKSEKLQNKTILDYDLALNPPASGESTIVVKFVVIDQFGKKTTESTKFQP